MENSKTIAASSNPFALGSGPGVVSLDPKIGRFLLETPENRGIQEIKIPFFSVENDIMCDQFWQKVSHSVGDYI